MPYYLVTPEGEIVLASMGPLGDLKYHFVIQDDGKWIPGEARFDFKSQAFGRKTDEELARRKKKRELESKILSLERSNPEVALVLKLFLGLIPV